MDKQDIVDPTQVESCSVPMKRCFITGEQCTHQHNISRTRASNYDEGIAPAFVVMAFTDMTKATYETIIKPEIEKYGKQILLLKKTNTGHEIICCSEADREKKLKEGNKEISTIAVNRADQEAMFGYIICNQVCQQIQIADIVVIDFSKDNPNVFYEFGLSMALGKLIIPICYDDDYEKEEIIKKSSIEAKETKDKQWKRQLYEYFSLIAEDTLSNEKITSELYPEYTKKDFLRYWHSASSAEGVERKNNEEIYNHLKRNLKELNPTLLRYSSGGFIDKSFENVIIHFYNNVKHLCASKVFKGDRIAVLAQDEYIYDFDKEDSKRKPTPHSVANLLYFGVNQACHSVEEMMIKPSEKVPVSDADKKNDPIAQKNEEKEVLRFLEDYRLRQGYLIFPRKPVSDLIFDRDKNPLRGTLFDTMLDLLCFAYQVVIDTELNDVFSLFWLGVSHGLGTYAVRVIRNYSDKELDSTSLSYSPIRKPRSVFDVSGLWTAEIQSDKIDIFFQQLQTVQMGIARHRKLLPSGNKSIVNPLKKFDPRSPEEKLTNYKSFESYYRRKMWEAVLRYGKLHIIIGADAAAAKPDQKYSGDEESKESRTVRITIGDWDYLSMALFTEYSLAHSMINKYLIREFPKDAKKNIEDYKKLVEHDNSILIGDNTVNSFTNTIIDHIRKNYAPVEIHKRKSEGEIQTENIKKVFDGIKENCRKKERELVNGASFNDEIVSCRLFESIVDENGSDTERDKSLFHWYQPSRHCIICKVNDCDLRKKEITDKIPDGYRSHYAYAQLVIFRDIEPNKAEQENFKILLCGGSGPATFALSSLFVNEDIKYQTTEKKYSGNDHLKEGIFGSPEGYLLVKLQEEIREQVLSKIHTKINEISKGFAGNNLPEYVKLALKEYIRILLSKHFLPILYDDDIAGIKSALQLFARELMKMKSINAHQEYDGFFKKVDEVVKPIERIVGIEAMFKVEVLHAAQDSQIPNPDPDERAVYDMNIAKCGDDNAVFLIEKKPK